MELCKVRLLPTVFTISPPPKEESASLGKSELKFEYTQNILFWRFSHIQQCSEAILLCAGDPTKVNQVQGKQMIFGKKNPTTIPMIKWEKVTKNRRPLSREPGLSPKYRWVWCPPPPYPQINIRARVTSSTVVEK